MNTKPDHCRDLKSQSDKTPEVSSPVSGKSVAEVASILNISITQVQRAVDDVHICGLTRDQQLDAMWKDLLGPDEHTRYMSDTRGG